MRVLHDHTTAHTPVLWGTTITKLEQSIENVEVTVRVRSRFVHTNERERERERARARVGSSIDRLPLISGCGRLQFSNGDVGVFDLVVACDGLRSKTRQMGGFGEVPVTFWGFKAWYALTHWLLHCLSLSLSVVLMLEAHTPRVHRGFWVRRTPMMDIHAVTEIWGPGGKVPHASMQSNAIPRSRARTGTGTGTGTAELTRCCGGRWLACIRTAMT